MTIIYCNILCELKRCTCSCAVREAQYSIHVAWSVYNLGSQAGYFLQSQHRPELLLNATKVLPSLSCCSASKLNWKLKVKVYQLPAPNKTLYPANDWPGDQSQGQEVYLDCQGGNDGLGVHQAGVTQVVQACTAHNPLYAVKIDRDKCKPK